MKHVQNMSLTTEEYVNVRMPKSEYDRLKQARDELSQQPNYSWVGHVALGVFIGFLIGLAIKAATEE